MAKSKASDKREAPQASTGNAKRTKTDTPKTRTEVGTTLSKQRGPIYSFFQKTERSLNSSSTVTPQPQNLVSSFESADTAEIFSEPENGEISSNNTSLLDDDFDRRESQYSGGTELDQALLESFELDRALKQVDGPPPATVKQLLDDLVATGPFKKVQKQWVDHLPYWLIFELYRFSIHLDGDVGKFYYNVTTVHKAKQQDRDQFWKAAKTIFSDQHKNLPVKSDIRDWTLQGDRYSDKETSQSVTFAARLRIPQKFEGKLFELELRPLAVEKSCRLHRKFGADRFLILDVPSVTSFPRFLKDSLPEEKLHKRYFDHLTSNNLYIAGRVWRAFYIESKDQTRKQQEQNGVMLRLYLFAIDGFDFGEMPDPERKVHHRTSLTDFVQWHLPIHANKQSTDLKLFARMHLGLSRTTPTVALLPSEFIRVPDKRARTSSGEDGAIMTDGCARISYEFALEVWKVCGKESVDLPSAFQGRISGAKGLWQVDYTNSHPDASERNWWIEISESQLKIEPHPKDRIDADEHLRTFEVVRYSRPCSPTQLNKQLIYVLSHRQVPRSRLQKAIQRDLIGFFDSLNEAMSKGSVALRVWRQVNLPSSLKKDSLKFCGAMPDSLEDELDYLLESGFDPRYCEYLVECLRVLLKLYLERYIDKLRIKIPFSTNTYCVPDPLGVLAPGEVQLNFSQPWNHPRTKLPDMYLKNINVLVARNPAALPSDMQMVKAVYYHELQYTRDVIIFPTQGNEPLAGMLSGGDYDGDTVTAIWDPDITERFVNLPVPQLPGKAECAVVSRNRLVHSIYDSDRICDDQMDKFLNGAFAFNGVPNLLGPVTKHHEKLMYVSLSEMTSPEGLKLAALRSYLVDCVKQGDVLTLDAWTDLRASINDEVRRRRPRCRIQKPAHEGGDMRDRGPGGVHVDIIDFLKFDVAEKLKDKVLGDFKTKYSLRAQASDADVRKPFKNEWKRAEKSAKEKNNGPMSVLVDLRDRVRVLNDEYTLRCRRRDGEPVANNYRKMVEQLCNQYSDLEPRNIDCDIRREFLRYGHAPGSPWPLLKASCVHYHHASSDMSWIIAGDEICRVKARSQPGRTWEMTLSARQIMKADTKKYKRLVAYDESDREGDGGDA